MSQREDDLPTPVWSGTLTLLGVELRCHVLSNGQRIIEADSVNDFLYALESGDAPASLSREEVEAFAQFRRGDYGHA